MKSELTLKHSRDLTEAADIIVDMNSGCSTLIRTIENSSAQSRDIHAKSLIGFKSNLNLNNSFSQTDEVNAPYLILASQVKLMTLFPEKLWALVDNKVRMNKLEPMLLFLRHSLKFTLPQLFFRTFIQPLSCIYSQDMST